MEGKKSPERTGLSKEAIKKWSDMYNHALGIGLKSFASIVYRDSSGTEVIDFFPSVERIIVDQPVPANPVDQVPTQEELSQPGTVFEQPRSSLERLVDPEDTQLTLPEFLKARRSEMHHDIESETANRRNKRSTFGQEDVARRAGISLAWYQKIEQGRTKKMSTDVLLNIASAVDLDETQQMRFVQRFGRKI